MLYKDPSQTMQSINHVCLYTNKQSSRAKWQSRNMHDKQEQVYKGKHAKFQNWKLLRNMNYISWGKIAPLAYKTLKCSKCARRKWAGMRSKSTTKAFKKIWKEKGKTFPHLRGPRRKRWQNTSKAHKKSETQRMLSNRGRKMEQRGIWKKKKKGLG